MPVWFNSAAWSTNPCLRCDANDRYHMHEQVRQFAGARLGADPVALTTIHRRHTTYYAAFAAAQHTLPSGIPDDATIAAFDRELENLRLALAHALAENDIARVAPMLESLWPYYRFKGWNREIVATMQQACDLRDVPLAQLARWLRWWAEALYQMGELRASIHKVEQLMRRLVRRCPIQKPVRAGSQRARIRAVNFCIVFSRKLLYRSTWRSNSELLVEMARALERYGQAGYILDNQIEVCDRQ